MRENLFTLSTFEVPPADDMRMQYSPLEGYVVGEMPADLRAVSKGHMTYDELNAKHAGILEDLTPRIVDNTDPYAARVTQLDLLCLLGGYIPSGDAMQRTVPTPLATLIDAQRDRFGMEPYMSYELLIELNAQEYERTGRMRVFADGKNGLHERDFYLGHYLADPHARDAAYALRYLAQNAYNQQDVPNILETAMDNVGEFKRYMARYAALPKESFAYFRQFLNSYPDGTRNASGAFMPSVPLMELALTAPSEVYNVYLDESMPYFPGYARPTITDWRDTSAEGVNIEDRLGKLPGGDVARKIILGIVDEFIHFRMIHLGITRNYVPDDFSRLDRLTRKNLEQMEGEAQILDPEVKGTAGFDVRNVLANSVHRLFKLRKRLMSEEGM